MPKAVARHHHRQDASTTACSARRENSVVVDDADRRGGEAASSRRRAATSCPPAEIDAVARVLVTPQRLPTRRSSASRRRTSPQQAGITVAAGDARAHRAARRASAATTRSRSRSSARCSPSTSWPTGAKAASAASRSCATAGMGHTMSIHSQNDAGHPGVRPQEAGLPHRRQHADDARLDRADDRARSGDDARLRRLRRQHHLRQHLAAAPAEHQAAGVRDDARGAARPPRIGARGPALPRRPPLRHRHRGVGAGRWPSASTSSWRPGATSPRRPVQARRSRRERRPARGGAVRCEAGSGARSCPAGPAARLRLRRRRAAGDAGRVASSSSANGRS